MMFVWSAEDSVPLELRPDSLQPVAVVAVAGLEAGLLILL